MFKRMTVIALSWLAACAMQVHAQSYPNKPIRLVLGYTVGGAADAIARPLVRVLEPILGQSIVIEAKPGAAGGVAADFISKVTPDGYTLYLADGGPFTTAPHLTKVGYHYLNSFTHIGHVCGNGSVLAVHPSSPFKSVADVVAAAKKEPDKWSYGTSGMAGPHHLSGELFKSYTGVNLVHVPYRGGAPAILSTVQGDTQISVMSSLVSAPHIEAGKLRAIAIGSRERDPQFPNVPTMAEVGFPDIEAVTWVGMFAPAGTPRAIVERLNREINRIIQEPDIRGKLMQQGIVPVGGTPEDFGAYISAEIRRWTAVARANGIKMEQ